MKPRDRKRLKPFRQKLTELRKKRGLSQRGLSYVCDVSPSKINSLENDENSNLNITTLFELARGLEVHPNILLNFEIDWEQK
jgi:transcriptional regulator with XRE-family HTH domain